MLFPVAIIAGGLGTRLRPLSDQVPKSLIDINGEPFVAHQLRLLQSRGAKQVVVCTGHLGHLIHDFVADGSRFCVRVTYSDDGPLLRGTGGAVRQAIPLLGDRFFVLYGDSYLPCDYASIQRAFENSGKRGLMTVYKNHGRWDASNVEFNSGKIIEYDKILRNPRMTHIDYGLGVFSREAFTQFHCDPLDMALVYQTLLHQGQLAAYEVRERFYEIGSMEGIADLSTYLAQQPVL